MTPVPLDQLTFATFVTLLRSHFRVHLGPSAVLELELVEATCAPTAQGSPKHPASESFSLIFAGPAAQPLTQKIYLFEHETIGAFELFIVPITTERGTLRYQAVFNRLLPPKPS